MGEDFNYGSQLIVAESEEALFFKDGIIESTFEGGKYIFHMLSILIQWFQKGLRSTILQSVKILYLD